MPRCYLLSVCSGSSLDRHSNNVTLFNLVEQINLPANAQPPPGGVIPLEVHAYWQLLPDEVDRQFEMRLVLVGQTGLEHSSDTFPHTPSTPRFRTRTLGLPFPPAAGQYLLRVDWRFPGSDSWKRDAVAWPVAVTEVEQKPAVVH